jgi:hypothetical protein
LSPYLIVVSLGTGGGDGGEILGTSTTATTTATTTTTTVTSNGGGGYSAHYSQASLSQATESAPAVGAGRARLAAVGADIAFEAYKDKVGTCAGTYTWTFGDGTTATGEKVAHHYDFAGEYQVVLNGTFCNGASVARTVVKVVEPKLAISNVALDPGYVEIENRGADEMNLGQWKLVAANSNFAFPADTIIAPAARLKIPLATAKLTLASGADLVLANPLGQTASAFPLVDSLLADIGKKIEVLRREISDLKMKRG